MQEAVAETLWMVPLGPGAPVRLPGRIFGPHPGSQLLCGDCLHPCWPWQQQVQLAGTGLKLSLEATTSAAGRYWS